MAVAAVNWLLVWRILLSIASMPSLQELAASANTITKTPSLH